MKNFIYRLFKKFERLKKRYEDPVRNFNCSEFEVDNWIISNFILNELIPIVDIRPYPLEELCLMTSSICRLKPTQLFEWGTHLGKSARIFFEISQHFGIQMEINSIDLPDHVEHIEHPGQNRGVLLKGIKGVTLHKGDGVKISIGICKKLPENERLLFFIDGDHRYETVLDELEEIIKEVPDSDILLHDTFFQSSESGYNTGPCRAINDILRKYPDKFLTISTTLGLPGMTLLFQREKILSKQIFA